MSEFGLLTLPFSAMEIQGVTQVPHDMNRGGL